MCVKHFPHILATLYVKPISTFNRHIVTQSTLPHPRSWPHSPYPKSSWHFKYHPNGACFRLAWWLKVEEKRGKCGTLFVINEPGMWRNVVYSVTCEWVPHSFAGDVAWLFVKLCGVRAVLACRCVCGCAQVRMCAELNLSSALRGAEHISTRV